MRKQILLSKVRRRVMVTVLGVTLSAVTLSLPTNLLTAQAEIVKTSNVELGTYNNGYSGYWASPIYSYLVECDNGNLMRVQRDNGVTVVEYYDRDFNVINYKELEAELPIFGGFYEGSDAYYIVTGQNNKSEDNNVECFRITKYDKSWNRIASTGLSNCNTTVPFDAGSLRMTEANGYLFIRTSHEMYTTGDGYNHQANVTIQIDEKNMRITDYLTDISNTGTGYASHSFNQFIKTENNHIVAVDHGDAYPRSIALMEYPTDFTGGQFVSNMNWGDECKVTDLFSFTGSEGNNYTGASVGGFEITNSAYLVTMNSIDQENGGSVRNVYIVGKSKTDDTLIKTQLTNYTDKSASTPYLIKVEDNKYMVLWDISSSNDNEVDNKVYYTYIDGSGKQIGNEIKSIHGDLSQCEPIVYNGTVLWYSSTGDDKNITFYGIKEDGSELKLPLNVTQQVEQNGRDIKITANGNGGVGTLTYKFLMYNADTKEWTQLQDYSKSNEYTGNISQTGNLYFYTDVKDDCDEVVRSEATNIKIDKVASDDDGKKDDTNNGNNTSTKDDNNNSNNDITKDDDNKNNNSTINGDNNNSNNNNNGNNNTTKDDDNKNNNSTINGDNNNSNNNNNGSNNTTKDDDNKNNNSTINGDNNNTNKISGLIQGVDGNWYYYVDGVVDTNYTGLAENQYGWWKITNGTVDFGYNGLGLNEYGWWKVTNGAVDLSFNGIAENEYGWWKITNGTVDFSANGLQFDVGTDTWWYFNGGAIDMSYTGLAENEYGWWKITNGTVDFGYNGLGLNQYGWWKVTNGIVDLSYTGLAENEYGWWYVTNGLIDFSYTGQADNIYGTWNVVNGRVVL